MSKKEKSTKEDIGHPVGLSPMDNGQFPEELEGSEKAFRKPSGFWDRPNAKDVQGTDGVMGPGGDSRPDPPRQGGFIAAEEHQITDERRGPEIVHEDPDRLREQRVDQADEIVPRYDRATDGEKAELRPRVSKKGAESEGL